MAKGKESISGLLFPLDEILAMSLVKSAEGNGEKRGNLNIEMANDLLKKLPKGNICREELAKKLAEQNNGRGKLEVLELKGHEH